MALMNSPIDSLKSLVFDKDGPPRYEQLASFFEHAIRSGDLNPGDRLPTVRQIAAQMNLSATTISSAFDLLGTRKFVRAEVGRGTFVASDWHGNLGLSSQPTWAARTLRSPRYTGQVPWRRKALMRASSRLRSSYPQAMECSTGRPDPNLLPVEIVRRAWSKCINEVTARDLQYAGPEPIQPLAEILVKTFESDSIPARAQDIVIGSSAQQFFALIQEVVTARSESSRITIAVEEPGYPTLLDTLERAGAQLLGVAVDRFGVTPTSLDAALREGAELVFLTPRGHNPTGATWSKERVAELAEVLKTHPNVVVVEDDQVAGIAASKPGSLLSVPKLENRILHVRSFSKSIAPDLRMAAAVIREPLREPLVEAKSFADGWSSRLLQRVLTKTLQAEEILEALNGARDAYRDRRLSACRAMSRILSARGGPAGLVLMV